MIAWLSGQVIDKNHPGKLVLDVQGVGYDVETSLNTFFQIEHHPQTISLHIHTLVREDALLLYGFLEKQERSLFRTLIKVNGVGPRLAMTILSSLSPGEFIQCIHQENSSLLTKIPGIGKKTAERLIIEMRDSMKQFGEAPSDSGLPPLNTPRHSDEAISALEVLGYKPQEASKVIQKIDDGVKNCEQLIREALQILA